MVVVLHHIGRPRHSTISQNERMMWLRRRTSDAFSGGGTFRVGVSLLAVAGPGLLIDGGVSASPLPGGC